MNVETDSCDWYASSMGSRLSLFRGYILLGMIFTGVNMMFLWSQLLQVTPTKTECVCDCEGKDHVTRLAHSTISSTLPVSRTHNSSRAKAVKGFGRSGRLAVVVPFRNRYEEMMEFVPYIHDFLLRQKVGHHIWVVNQVDNHRFNRASLLNIGFLLSKNECDFMVMHDIDLLPLNDDLIYEFPSKGPFHVSSPELHPLYHYKTFVGGILILSREQFEKVNGLSNLFWGWGREDDELYVRMREAGMTVHYPRGIMTGHRTFKHIHDRDKRPRDQQRLKNQRELSNQRDRKTGVDSVKYKLVSNIEMSISGAPLNFVSVELHCDYDVTPFCDS